MCEPKTQAQSNFKLIINEKDHRFVEKKKLS